MSRGRRTSADIALGRQQSVETTDRRPVPYPQAPRPRQNPPVRPSDYNIGQEPNGPTIRIREGLNYPANVVFAPGHLSMLPASRGVSQ